MIQILNVLPGVRTVQAVKPSPVAPIGDKVQISLNQWLDTLTPAKKIRFGNANGATPVYDLVVVGAGPAGVSASVYAVRRQLKTLLLEKALVVGGYVAQTRIIENYPSTYSVTGAALAKQYDDRLKQMQDPKNPLSSFFSMQLGKKVVKLEKQANGEFELLLDDHTKVKAKAVIVATGIVRRKVPIKGFDAFLHKGVSMCTICDGPLFKNQDVAMIGHDQAAIDAAIYMAGLAKSLVLVADKPINASAETIAKLKSMPTVKQIFEESKVQEIAGQNAVQSVVVKDKAGRETTLLVTGVFMESDMVSSAKFVEGTLIAMDDKGQVMIDNDLNAGVTGPDGLFAAGDVTTEAYKQITIAEAQGTKAALKAAEYLQGKTVKTDYGKNHARPGGTPETEEPQE